EQVPDLLFQYRGRCRTLALALPDRVLELVVAAFKRACHRHLLLGVELDALFALDVHVAVEAVVPAREGERSHRSRHADVDANHAGVEVALELTCGPSAAGEDNSTVAEGAVFAEINCFLHG